MSFVGEVNKTYSRAMQKIKETQNLSEVSQPFKQGLTIESWLGLTNRISTIDLWWPTKDYICIHIRYGYRVILLYMAKHVQIRLLKRLLQK